MRGPLASRDLIFRCSHVPEQGDLIQQVFVDGDIEEDGGASAVLRA